MRLCCGVFLCLALMTGFAAHTLAADRWGEYGTVAKQIDAIEPTPIGDGHIGLVESGKMVQLRFPVPQDEAAGYWVRLGGVVAFSGRGAGYQLILRKDAADGPILHEGPVIANGDEWNTSNRPVIDLTDALTAADRERGYVDVFVTGIVKDDGWTVYRAGSGRDLCALAAILSPEARAQLAAAKALRDSGVSLIPLPRKIEVTEGQLKLTAQTRILYAAESLHIAAEELQAVIEERTGLKLPVEQAATGAQGDIVLTSPESAGGAEAYSLTVTSEGATVRPGGDPGGFYGAMTLGQMVRRTDEGAVIPKCSVDDAPAFPYRIIQYDIARGQTVDVDYVKRVIREFARCKISALLFYMEDDFRFHKYPFLGREGTFTHEKARELSEYAHRYHVQLIPQFEALGHAGAVLSHDEVKDLREAGDAWVFCTRTPRTWEFLDDVFGELVEAFPYTEFIHTGADEFEFGFGKCDQCKAVVSEKGIGGLYAEHMNKLNQLVKKHGRKMMFWPSHHGPTPELTNMTIQYEKMLEKDCIPTEWIYHGPSTYPTIKQYQDLGFEDVYCCPAVESYSRVWPDHQTTFRGIRGFYQAGQDRGVGGVYCTTWEFMHGALIENSMYGLIFAADCSWNPTSTSKEEYSRRFADWWFGVSEPGSAELIETTVSDPVPAEGKAAMWRSGWLLSKILWTEPRNVMRGWALKEPAVAANADTLPPLADEARKRADALAAKARRNQLTLRANKLAYAMMRYATTKLAAYREMTRLYAGLRKALGEGESVDVRGADLATIVQTLDALEAQAAALAEEYGYFVDHCGAYKGDATRLAEQARQFGELREQLAALGSLLAAPEKLPSGREFGFLSGTYAKAGEWTDAKVTEAGTTVTFDITDKLTAPGPLEIEWQYTRGAHGLSINATRLLCDGQVVSEDVHGGWTGAGSRGNVYALQLKEYRQDGKYELVGDVASAGGVDSWGTVWLIKPEE